MERRAEVVPIEVYYGPKRISTAPPKYPRRALRREEEGWVQLNLMVDTDGKAYEISASDYAGDAEFVDAAIAAIKRWRFEPAHLDGVPLDAGASFKITFALRGGVNGASSRFVKAYKELVGAITREERVEADVLLRKLQVKNLYEDAYSNIAQFLYAEKWGSERTQRHALRQAIAFEDDATYLPAALFSWGLRRLIVLQLAEEHHPEALASTRRLLDERRKLPEEQRAIFQKLQDELLVLRDSDSSFARQATVGKSNRYWLALWRDQFSVQVLSGEVAELKLRCGKGYVFFRFDPELTYRAPNADKSCTLEVVGNPGSELRITQH